MINIKKYYPFKTKMSNTIAIMGNPSQEMENELIQMELIDLKQLRVELINQINHVTNKTPQWVLTFFDIKKSDLND